MYIFAKAGLQEPGVLLSDQLTLTQPEGADYAHQITTGTGTPDFSDLPTVLVTIPTVEILSGKNAHAWVSITQTIYQLEPDVP